MRRTWLVLSLFSLGAMSALLMQTRTAPGTSIARAQPIGQAQSITLAQGTVTALPSYEGTTAAPEFPTDVEWINVPQPLTLAQLRGKVILLDFWTYGCINCIHIIPDLKRLEAEFADELVIIGVHSAKFSTEGKTANIREIVQRYEIEHPVINDNKFQIWDTYGVQAWPTTLLIDPTGKVLGAYSGEGVYDALQPIIGAMITQFDARKQIDRKPIRYTPELAKRAPSALSFPGKVLADPAGGRLFISDSNHNRLIVADLKTFEVKAVIGSSAPGLHDGTFTTATFYRPQGLALSGETLYIADTENHAIRAVDLKAGTVTTLAGTGQQAQTHSAGGTALKTALNSPWDVAAVKDTLYIAMAGSHQLWALDLKSSTISPYAGSGAEGLQDAPLREAKLAQPSGITSFGSRLYFTDPEASAIRSADLDSAANGAVHTLIGVGLFDFGDIDGVADQARLQHALGVTVGTGGRLYIADTYNSKIKQIDPATRESKTLFGHVEGGLRDGADPLFSEPGGLSFAEDKLYIADTNNNLIRVADLTTGQVSTVVFPNADVLAVQTASAPSGEPIRLDAQTVAPGESQLIVDIGVPQGYRLNDTAPFELHIVPGDGNAVVPADKADLAVVQPTMPITLPITLKTGQTDLIADVDVYYCDAINETLCYVSRLHLTAPLTIAAGGAPSVKLAYTVTPSKTPISTISGKKP